jgi:hypothetical protein
MVNREKTINQQKAVEQNGESPVSIDKSVSRE